LRGDGETGEAEREAVVDIEGVAEGGPPNTFI